MIDWAEYARKNWDADRWAKCVLLKAWPTFEQSFELARQLGMIRDGKLLPAPAEGLDFSALDIDDFLRRYMGVPLEMEDARAIGCSVPAYRDAGPPARWVIAATGIV